MKNSAIFNFFKKEHKLIISWILIIILLFVGIQWPSFTPKADIISDLGLRYITTDVNRPYTLLTAEIEGSLNSVDYYLYQTNAPIYFFSDLKAIGIRASETDVSSGFITVKKYQYDGALQTWSEIATQTIDNSCIVSNVLSEEKYGSFSDNQGFYKISSVGGSYGVIDAIDDFGLSNYVPSIYGEYIIGYCGTATNKSYILENGDTSVEGRNILNKNFINYKKFDSNLNIYPIHEVYSSKIQDGEDLSLSNFYRTINLFNSNNESGGYYYSNGSDSINLSDTIMHFSFEMFNSDEYQNEKAILNEAIEVPVKYVDFYNNSEILLDWYAKDIEIIGIANESGIISNPTVVTETIGNETIIRINNSHEIVFNLNDINSKKFESIEINRLNTASDYISCAVKIPVVQYNYFNGQEIGIGRFLTLVLKESDGNPSSYSQVLEILDAVNNESDFTNKLMIYNNYMDYDFSKTYNSTNKSINNSFLTDTNYSKDIYLRAFSSETNIQNSTFDGFNNLVSINNGITTYTFYGQLMGYLPESKSSNVKFNLNTFANDKTDLYVSNDGLTIYYSSDEDSSEKIDLVTVENKDGKSELKLFADNIAEYRLAQQNINAFNSFILNASCESNSRTFTKSLTVKLFDENNSSLVEMYKSSKTDSSFKENWEEIIVEELVTSLPVENRYPQLPNSRTEMNSPFATLINYGEYQLLLYTSVEPKYISGSLNLESSADIEVWRYYNKNWMFENYVSELTNGSIDLPMKANLSAIDFINYDLKDSYSKEIVLEANKTYDDGSPKLRTIKIPQLVSSDAYHYIFVNNSIGFYAFTSSEAITAEGNELVKYPDTGKWYALIQNSWVEITEEVAEINNFNTIDRYDFEKALRFTNDNNSAWTNVEPWESSNWSSSVDYFRYIPIYSATSGYNYIIYETSEGFESLEFSSNITGGITITENGLKFNSELVSNGNSYSGIILKKYSGGFWTPENEDIIKSYISFDDGEYFFNRPGAINSIIYSNRDILDLNGNVIISNMFSQSLIVSNSLSIADLSCIKPISDSNEITINGISYPYVILTQETINGQTTYVSYISNQEFKYTTAATTGFDIISNDYPLTVYKQVWNMSTNKWNTPELVYSISEDAGVVDNFSKTYTVKSNGVITAIYNQYPNGRVDKYDSTLSENSKQEGHFILTLKEDMSNSSLPENAYEVYFDREGNEYKGVWEWKWSDTQAELLDYYCTPDGTVVKDTTRSHRYYKFIDFEASGNRNEFYNTGKYLSFEGAEISMGYKDCLGNWFNETGIVVTPSGDYGYYDENLNIVSTRSQGEYFYALEEDGNIRAELWEFAEEINPEEVSNRIVDICNSDDIKWINRDVAPFENVPLDAETFKDVTFLDSSIDAILGDFIDPEKVSGGLEYISPQINNGQANYWITLFDTCGKIYNPFSNNGQGKVAENLDNVRFIVPNFGNVQRIFSGSIPRDGIAFDVSSFSPESQILKSESDWYVKLDVSNDILNPVINSVYMVNHTLKIDAIDPGAFATIFDSEGNVKYKAHNFENVDIYYEYVPNKEYSNSSLKNSKDADGIDYYKIQNNKSYKLLDNNNVIFCSYDIDENGNTIEVLDGGFNFAYTKINQMEDFIDLSTNETISNNNSVTGMVDFYLTIPRYIEKNDATYVLSEDYHIVDNVLYKEVDSSSIYEKKVSIEKNEILESFIVYNGGPVDDITVDNNHGSISIVNGDYIYTYGNYSIPLTLNKLNFFTTDKNETWAVIMSETSVSFEGEIVTFKLVSVNTYTKAKEYKYVYPSEYIKDTVSFTRLLKKLSDEDISRILSDAEGGTTWAALVSANDNKGLYQYYDKGNSPWEGFSVEALSGCSIGDDGYVYRDGEKMPADKTYDENGNEVQYDVSGVENYYITVEEDFSSDMAFSYIDIYGETINIEKGQRVPSIDKLGNKTTIPLTNNTFIFPADQNSGEFTFSAYVVDGAGNKSTTISGPWTISRNNLATTKDWREFFVDGKETQAIQFEIESAIKANTTDTKAPKITGVFLYKGNLYIVAIDEDDKETGSKASGIGMIGTYNYLFNHTSFEDESLYTLKERTYFSDSSMTQKVQKGTILSDILNIDLGQQEASFEVFKNENDDILTAELDLSVFDIARNQSGIVHVEISEDKNNSVLFGNVSQTIYEMLLEERNKEGQEDNIAPIIKAIYALNNVLYVEAEDNLGISSYGYKWVLDSIMPVETKGLDDEGHEITINAGDDIPKGTIIWHGAAQQAITVPTKMIIYVEDIEGNASYETVVISSGNQLLYGEVSDEIKEQIKGEGGEPDALNVAPTIENVYTYKGYLYVEGFDSDNNLATWCYGFNPLDNMSLKSDYQGYNAAFNFIDIPAGTTIKANQQIYKKINSQEINIPMNITVSMRDSLGLETSETYYIFKDNYVYKGTAPEDLKDEIEKPSGGDEKPSITPTPGGEGEEDIPTPTPTPGPLNPEKPIPVPDDFGEIDWKEYDFMFEIFDKDTNRVVYKIIQDEASAIDCPRLENSVLYKYEMSAINEETGGTLVTAKGEIRMTDTIAPTITKIWYSKNRIYVSAYDLGGFDDKPFNFMIEGSRDSADKFISNNNTVVLSGETVQVKVRDAAGNTATAKVEINEKTKDILYESLNPKEYLYINSSETKSLAYWFAYINTTYGIDVSNSYLSEKNKSENVNFEIKNNNVYIDLKGDGVISFYDNKTNKYLALNLRTLNTGKSYRSIVVQTTSEIDVSLAFKNKLLEQFGTIDGLSWYADGTVLSRIGSRVAANQTGVGTIKFVHDGKEMNAYILVADSISGTKTSCDFEKENFAYTYLLKDKVSFRDALRLPTPATEEDIDEIDFIVMEDVSQGVIRKGNDLRFSSPGLKTLELINCVNDELGEIKFEVISLTPYISKFTDIIGSDARADIEMLCEKGFVGDYPDEKYKPVNKMTTKEFLTMVNKIKMTYDSDFKIDKVFTSLNLSEKDFDYYSSQNVLINMSQTDVDKTIGTYTLNKAITFEEVVKLISATLLYDKYHNEEGIEAPESLSECAQEAIHLISMGIIDEKEERNATRELTRAEIAYLLTKTIKFLEL